MFCEFLIIQTQLIIWILRISLNIFINTFVFIYTTTNSGKISVGNNDGHKINGNFEATIQLLPFMYLANFILF